MTKGYTKYTASKRFRSKISGRPYGRGQGLVVLLYLYITYFDLFSNISNGNIQMHDKYIAFIGKVQLHLLNISFQSNFYSGAII